MAFYYVDFENVHTSGLLGIEELSRFDSVFIYCRETDIKRVEAVIKEKKIKSIVKCIMVEGVTKNALDFELLSDLFLCKKHDLKIIVSKDKGFDAAVRKGIRNKFLCVRQESIGQNKIPMFLEEYGNLGREIIVK